MVKHNQAFGECLLGAEAFKDLGNLRILSSNKFFKLLVPPFDSVSGLGATIFSHIETIKCCSHNRLAMADGTHYSNLR